MFARGRIEEFITTVLDGRSSAPMRDVPVKDDEDYVRLFFIASYGLGDASSFRLQPSDGRLHTPTYGYPDGTLEVGRHKGRGQAR